ncbi:hypothetical protein [Paraburkholderia dipogonis]|uniref:hypothetical protein n=1 Tax=Paraburkholderia dipogonis TaxID=1211383 RepID=UPI0038B99165
MDDLFRFLMLRPANLPSPDDVKTLVPSFVKQGANRDVARKAAAGFVAQGSVLSSTDRLAFTSAALAVAAALRPGPLPAKDVSVIIEKQAGRPAGEVVANVRFGADEARLADSLVAMKLLSDSSGGDAPGLALLAQGYDAIRQVTSGRDPVSLRVLSLPAFAANAQIGEPPVKDTGLSKSAMAPEGSDPLAAIRQLDAAIATLRTVPASGFRTDDASASADPGAPTLRVDTRLAQAQTAGPDSKKQPANLVSQPVLTHPWMLSEAAISVIPPPILATIAEAGIDLSTQSLPVVINALHAQRVGKTMVVERAKMLDNRSFQHIGSSFTEVASNDYVGTPSAPMPTRPGNVRPVGVGELLMVKQHVLRYEGGDLAHVENVLKSEHLSRDTRRLERTETTILQETETTKEEESDTQTTDRFSLNRETSDTIKTDASIKAGISVDAKYGPFIEVKANADYATTTATESSAKQATEFSKDVVARSASKLVERVLERRTVTTITEFEEKYSHGFDNTQGDGHISGYYQWIDKVMQAQVYRYGMRTLFDVTVPEPGTNFILAQASAPVEGQSLEKPPPFDLTADDISETNYTLWAQKYGVTELEPPPPLTKTISKVFSATVAQDPHESAASELIPIDDGYMATQAFLQRSMVFYPNHVCHVIVGASNFDAFLPQGYTDLTGETGSVAFGYFAYKVELLAGSVEIYCQRTDRGLQVWKLKTHAAILQGYEAKLQAYQQALAEASAATGVQIAGRNPIFNATLVALELRKQCLTLITGQQFDSFGALELSSEGYAQPNLAATESQMPYVRFFEQAFEWEHMMYFYYPYFWGWKGAWKNHMLLDDADPAFADFLRAGAARVVVPVRLGFDEAVVHYLESPTGEIWNGGPPPNISGDPNSLYLPIIKEIQDATGAPGDETPVDKPWPVRLPTTLVRIRPNNDLPTWNKVGEDWQPTN